MNIDDIHELLVCPSATTKQQKLDCLSSHRFRHCFQHTTRKSSCQRCSHSCQNEWSNIMTNILQKDLQNVNIRVGRHEVVGKKKVFFSPTHRRSEMTLKNAVTFISEKVKYNGLHNWTAKNDIRMTKFFVEPDTNLNKKFLYIGKSII